MSPHIATFVCFLGILGLSVLDRDKGGRTSRVLWLPAVWWLLIAGSRDASEWLRILGLGNFGASMDSPEKYLEGSPFDRNVLLALTAVGVYVLVQRQRKVGMLLRANGPVLLFFFYCAVSTLWSDYTDVAFKRWIKAVGDLVMVLIVLTDPYPLAAIKRLLSRVGFLLIPLSILFIKYYPDLGREYSHFDGRVTYTGVATTKNLLGMNCLIFGLGALWRLCRALSGSKRTRRTGGLIAQGALLAMVIWLFSMADSATALSCFLMAGSLIAVTSLGRLGRKPAVVHLLVLAVVCVSLSAVFGGTLLGTVGRDSTLTGRTDIWNLVLGMKGNSLVGTGFESFWIGWRREILWNVYRFHLNEAHNGYIEVYLNLGWIGVALLALLVVTGYRNVMAAFRREPDAGSLRLAYFVTALVYNLSEAGFRMLDPVWLFFLLAIFAVPELAISEGPLPHAIDPTDNLAERDSQVDNGLCVGLRQEGV